MPREKPLRPDQRTLAEFVISRLMFTGTSSVRRIHKALLEQVAIELGVEPADAEAILPEYALSLSTVKRYRTRIIDRIRKETSINIVAERGKRLRELQMIREEAWAAWLKSKEDHTLEVRRVGGDGGEGAPRATIERRHVRAVGDPSFLARVESVIMTECRLLGIDTSPITMDDEHDAEALRNELAGELARAALATDPQELQGLVEAALEAEPEGEDSHGHHRPVLEAGETREPSE